MVISNGLWALAGRQMLAAMMDVQTLAGVCAFATANAQRVVLVGDDRQLSAVGAGGGFTVAATGLETVPRTEAQRFTDPNHAQLAAAWRSSRDIEAVIEDVLLAIVRHDCEDDARMALAQKATDAGCVVMASDNETASAISRLARAERQPHGLVADSTTRLGRFEEQIGVGDVVQTRANDRELGVRNRDRWRVTSTSADGALTVAPIDRNGSVRRDRHVTLPPEYVEANVHHADAVTVYAAQGATAREGHAPVDDSCTREEAYVALTRGRDTNVLHVVAIDDDSVRHLLRGVLTHSQREGAEVVASLTRQRLALAQNWLGPGTPESGLGIAVVPPMTREEASRSAPHL